MILIDNLKTGFTTLWDKSKAYADGKIRDDQTNTTNTWSSQKIVDMLHTAGEDYAYFQGAIAPGDIDSLSSILSGALGYYAGVYRCTNTVTVDGIAFEVPLIFATPRTSYLNSQADGVALIMFGYTASGPTFASRTYSLDNGWGAWRLTVCAAVESSPSNTSLAAYVNSLS